MPSPLVSVVIPVGPRHVHHCRVAAASALRQSLPVEAIVIADGADVGNLPGCVQLETGGGRGPAHARNLGIARAQADYILFLDADDYLLPHGIAMLLDGLRRYPQARYTYGDAYVLTQDGQPSLRSAPDYDQGRQASYNAHVVTALCHTDDVRHVGGFDEGVDAWEDWTLWLRMAMAGYCGHRIQQPIFVYRVHEGDRMTRFYGGNVDLMRRVQDRYRDETGGIRMARCCGQTDEQQDMAQSLPPLHLDYAPMAVTAGLLRVEYLGEATKVPYTPPGTGQTVYLGTNPANRYADVSEQAAAWLVSLGVVRVVPAPAPFVDPPPPLEVPPEETVETVAAGTTAESVAPRRTRGRQA